MLKLTKLILISILIIYIAYAARSTTSQDDVTPTDPNVVDGSPTVSTLTTAPAPKKKVVKIKGDMSKIPDNIRQRILQDAAQAQGNKKFIYRLPGKDTQGAQEHSSDDESSNDDSGSGDSVLKKPILDLKKKLSGQAVLDANTGASGQ